MADVTGPTGGTSTPSQNTVYYDALLSTTLNAYRKTLYDNIFKDSAYLAYLRLVNADVKQNGGERIQMPLMYGTNKTVKSYSDYDTLDTTPQDGITSAFYEWKEVAGTVSISRREERQNSGEGRLINLLQSKIQQAEMSMREILNTMLLQGTVSSATFVPGNSAKDLLPLAYFLPKDETADPTAGGNVGNIARSTNSWWRPRNADASAGAAGTDFNITVSTYAGVKVAFKRLYNFCSRGSGGSPDLGVTDQESYEVYENSLDTQVRYTNTRMADMGFDTIKLRGATLIWDEIVPNVNDGSTDPSGTSDGTLFLLNTDFYKLTIDSETDIVTTPFVRLENQTAKTAKILFMGDACISNARKHGVLFGINNQITS